MAIRSGPQWPRDLGAVKPAFWTVRTVERPDPSQPAEDYALPGGRGTVGIIRPVSQPFCGACNRLRLTAEGSLRNCLFSHEDWNLRELLELPDSEQQLLARIEACVAAKLPGHLISQSGFRPPDRAMYQSAVSLASSVPAESRILKGFPGLILLAFTRHCDAHGI